jgi:hypothetical protein
MFPNLPDTFAKMIVYIGIGLITISGYLYINNLNKLERTADQLSDYKMEYVHAAHEDTFAHNIAVKSLIDLEQLAILVKNPNADLKKIVKEEDFRKGVYINLIRSKFHPDSVAKIYQSVNKSAHNDLDTMLKYSMLSKNLSAKIGANENKARIVKQKNRIILFIGLTGLPLLILGLIRWQRTESKGNALMDVQIELKKIELENERKKQASI